MLLGVKSYGVKLGCAQSAYHYLFARRNDHVVTRGGIPFRFVRNLIEYPTLMSSVERKMGFSTDVTRD